VDIAEQIFGEGLLRPPRPLAETARIVDAQAGCGFGVIYWLTQAPRAAVIAFEAHPDRVDAFVDNAELNAFWDQVLLHAKQASVAEGQGKLDSDEGFASLFKKGGASRYRNVKAADFFQMVGDAPISLLRLHLIDGEQPLLGDPRFPALKVEQLLVDSVTPERRGGLEQRLTQLGYRPLPDGADKGLLWATRG
jgi:hypothetical protein